MKVVPTLQRQEVPEEDEALKMKSIHAAIQRQELPSDKDELQMKPMASVQREQMAEEDEMQTKPTVQRVGVEGGAVSEGFEQELHAACGGGEALEPELQAQMGQVMGADFSGVRVHKDEPSTGDKHRAGDLRHRDAFSIDVKENQQEGIQRRKSSSRRQNRRTYKLGQDVKDHIFTRNEQGSGFHSIARDPVSLAEYVVSTTPVNDDQPYTANHLKNNKRDLAATGKTMFPQNWAEHDVVDAVEKAFTRAVSTAATQTRINSEGVTEQNNRPLHPDNDGKVRGKARGIRIEGIFQGGSLATAYPRV